MRSAHVATNARQMRARWPCLERRIGGMVGVGHHGSSRRQPWRSARSPRARRSTHPPPNGAKAWLWRVGQPCGCWRTGSTAGCGTGSSTTGSAWRPTDRLTETLHFFLYDTIKIALLLVGIIFVVTVLRSFMSIERTRALLGGRREGVGNVMAAGLGVVTPFCSCSAVPAFIGFVAAGVPIGVTLSFLIASPLVNEVAIGLLFGLFGWQVTAVYIGAGLTIAIVAGWVLGRLGVESWVEPFVFETTLGGQVIDSTAGLTLDQRIQMGVEEVGTHPAQDLALPARRHRARRGHPRLGARPTSSPPTPGPATRSASWSPSASASRCTPTPPASCPWSRPCYDKGLPMGTLLAFMMAVVALCLPEMILLRRVLKPPLLAHSSASSPPDRRRRLPVQPPPRLSRPNRKDTIDDHQGARPRLRQLQEPRTRHPRRPSTASASTPPSRRSPTTPPSSATASWPPPPSSSTRSSCSPAASQSRRDQAASDGRVLVMTDVGSVEPPTGLRP